MRIVKQMQSIILIAHNIRSCHNVGSFLRTADGLGIEEVIFTGYTPYPHTNNDERLPHISMKLNRQIHKSALGAETTQNWNYSLDIFDAIKKLKSRGYTVAALEQSEYSTLLPSYNPPEKIALIVGREVEGIEDEVLEMSDLIIEIPMAGEKESFNVSQAAAIALYHCKFFNNITIDR
jgi:23S rRNA (guanosine2251-2'-O)-methyltransferase